jgi:hypothetical protein
MSADWLRTVLLEAGFGPKDLVERYVYEQDSFTLSVSGRHKPQLEAMPKITVELLEPNNLQLTWGSYQVLLKPGADGVLAQALEFKEGTDSISKPELLRFMGHASWDDRIPDPNDPFLGFGAAVELLRALARSPLVPYNVQLSTYESLDTQHAEYVASNLLASFENDAERAKEFARQFPHSEHIVRAIDRLSHQK